MGSYNRGAYIRSTAAKLTRTLYEDLDAYLYVDGAVWRCLALAQARAMDRPSLAQSYLEDARDFIRVARQGAARAKREARG